MRENDNIKSFDQDEVRNGRRRSQKRVISHYLYLHQNLSNGCGGIWLLIVMDVIVYRKPYLVKD